MEILSHKRCGIGEGPIWNPFDEKLYYVDALADTVCTYDPATGEETARTYDFSVGAFGFTKEGRMLVSCTDGAFILHPDGSRTALALQAPIYCNDAKVGPDGRFYVGTQSRKRQGISEDVDGFTMGLDGRLYVACWGRGHLAVVDTDTMTVRDHIPMPVKIPVSCCFMGQNMDQLAVVTAAYGKEAAAPLAGSTFVADVGTAGRLPYVFG